MKEKIIENEMDIDNNLQDSDFKFMEEYVQFNTPIDEAIDILQGEKYPLQIFTADPTFSTKEISDFAEE